ncbi:hypothetical protein phiGM223_56 [Pseudomonas phage phiGM22-3]|uniref:Uncharacterized protein n=1 Tax=Pseudomonas phage phiGM22-3 TaxID=2816462 RepID=A0A8T8IVP8_9CAUD|nr:hypothetical protein phiGM223_56 [Pseudomonas phage phiGM22-3]
MAYADLTPAQRQNLSRLAHIAATETHRAREDFGVHGKETARIFLGNAYVTIDTVLNALAEALPQTTDDPLKAVVDNAQAVTVKNSAGTTVAPGTTAVVADHVLTNVKLPATQAVVTSGPLVTEATGSGTTVTLTVTNGAVSAVTLSG